MRRARRRTVREPTIALINIVFLMLVFFMAAGSLASPLDRTLDLATRGDWRGGRPTRWWSMPRAGSAIGGDDVGSAAECLAGALAEGTKAEGEGIRIVPDREVPAAKLFAVTGELRSAGAERVLIVTERGLE